MSAPLSPLVIDARLRERITEAVIAQGGLRHPALNAFLRARLGGKDVARGALFAEPAIEGAAAFKSSGKKIHELDGVLQPRVVEALIGAPGVTFAAVRRVRSHPVALGQCAGFFAAHPGLEAVEDFDTAGAAARVVAEGRGDEAALASEWAAAVYGGVILRAGVQDRADNATRFLSLRLRP